MTCRRLNCASPSDFSMIKTILDGRSQPDPVVEERVKSILNEVQTKGDSALIAYTKTFDCRDFNRNKLKVKPASMAQALTSIPKTDLRILEEAASNIRNYHERQRQNSWITTKNDGSIVGQLVIPVDHAGLYVPGGKGGDTPLVSSLFMNAIPALVAGVPEISVVSPPRADGTLNPYILAAAHLLELTEVYCCGSAWAIAALAFGTKTIRAVDVIAGPGNIYVTTAKRLLVGRVGIDMIAGPSEIFILADDSARPEEIAADMLSQAEHDPQAACICVSTHAPLLKQVEKALAAQLRQLPRSEIAAGALEKFGALIHVPNLETASALANCIAPEHLELLVQDPWILLPFIRNAGAIFLGRFAPEPVGDYFAGPNHVLPTMGTARFSSALGVETFMKKTSLVATSPAFLQSNGSKIARLARLEGLEAHARSVEIRRKS